jgi:hypothetical protein
MREKQLLKIALHSPLATGQTILHRRKTDSTFFGTKAIARLKVNAGGNRGYRRFAATSSPPDRRIPPTPLPCILSRSTPLIRARLVG